jgi:hypothetical protein
LRSGNSGFYPTLAAAEQTQLRDEAILIRKVFSFAAVSRTQFNAAWQVAERYRREVTRDDYLYEVGFIPDVPAFLDQSWASYVRGTRPTMPDVASSAAPLVCYPSLRNITLPDSTTAEIMGEACCERSQCSFTY